MPTPLKRRAVLALLGLTLAGAPTVLASEGACADERYSTLAAWVGRWQVVEDDQVTATTEFRSILGGCALEEIRQREDGGEERGLIYLDPESGEWRGRWVTSEGSTGDFRIEVDGDEATIAGAVVDVEGGRVWVRGRITPRLDGGWDNALELSRNGETYEAAGVTNFLPPGDVSRVAEVPPSAPSPPAPPTPVSTQPTPPPSESVEAAAPEVSPAPAEAPAPAAPVPAAEPESTTSQPTVLTLPVPEGVTVRSKRKRRQTQTINMESPMTLELEIGPLDQLPEDTAWLSTQLAPYTADSVSIRRVTAAKKKRRGRMALEMVLNLHTVGFQSRLDLEVDLISDGMVVAQEDTQGIAMGRMITAHDKDEGMPFEVRFEMDEAAFDALFADGKRPSVRITLGVR